MIARRLTLVILITAIVIAVAGATDHAGGWNDGSRLATIESLVDRQTWMIDESVFVRPTISAMNPFGADAADFPNGTQDKLFIDGHFYSDKSPVPALLLAIPYQIWRWCGGPSASERPDLFCWLLCLVSAGGAFVLSALGIDRLTRHAGITVGMRILIVGSFMLGSLALPYSRSVNNHILLLSMTAWLLVLIEQKSSALMIGSLAGIAYTIDLGAGPVILFMAFLVSSFSRGWPSRSLAFVVAAGPWVLLHHSLNYMIGGTIAPANSNPQYFLWPGCPFNATNLTGGWPHSSLWEFMVYSLDLLLGNKGFLMHQPQLCFALVAAVVLWGNRLIRRKVLVMTIGWFVGVWLLYAATSRNQSGVCVSVRWFVPLIAPAYWWLIQGLRARPECRKDVALLSVGGVLINVVDWVNGPWSGRVGPFFWIVIAISGCAWGWIAYRRTLEPTSNPKHTNRVAA